MPPVASGQIQPSPEAISLKPGSGPDWQWERQRILESIVRSVDRRRARGESVREAITYFAWYWGNRTYRTAPHRRIRLSKWRIRSVYYAWRRCGRASSAISLRFRAGKASVGPDTIRKLILACASPDVLSFSAAFRTLADPGVSLSSMLNRLPALTKAELKRRLEQRRALRTEMQEFRRSWTAKECAFRRAIAGLASAKGAGL